MVKAPTEELNVAAWRDAAAAGKKSWAEESPALKERYDKFIKKYKDDILEANKAEKDHKTILEEIRGYLGKFPPREEMDKYNAISENILNSQKLTHKMTPNFDKLTHGANNKTMNQVEADTILTELENDLKIYSGIVRSLGAEILLFRQIPYIQDIYSGIDRKKFGKPSGGGTRKRHHSYPLKHTFKNRRA
jgi:hypothetical protein